MGNLDYIVRVPKSVVDENRHRFPNHYGRAKIEAILICEKVYPRQKDRYNAYMKTMHWFALKMKKRRLMDNMCEACGSTYLIQVHHVNYKKLWDVELEDLEVLCEDCHYDGHRHS